MLRHGADPARVNDKAKDSALHRAIECASADAAARAKTVVTSLLENGAPVGFKNRKRRTAYALARELEEEAAERKEAGKEPLEEGGVPGLAAIVAKFDEVAAVYETKGAKKKKKKQRR